MNRGEVWSMTMDRKAGGINQSRPVVILSSDALAVLPLRVIVPLTDWKEEFNSAPWMVRVPPVLNSGVEKVMAADALQVRSVSTARLKHSLGRLPDKIVAEIASAVLNVLQN